MHLKDGHIKFDTVAKTIPQKALREMISGLSQKCSQYATELSGTIGIPGSDPAGLDAEPGDQQTLPGSAIPDYCAGDDVWQYCSGSEIKLLLVYRHILNESHLSEYIRKLVRMQFNGLLFAFLQIKLLR